MRFIPCSLKLEATMKANRIHAESRETDYSLQSNKMEEYKSTKHFFCDLDSHPFFTFNKDFSVFSWKGTRKEGGLLPSERQSGQLRVDDHGHIRHPLPPTHTPIHIVSPSSPFFPIRCWSLVSDSHPSP